MNVYTIFSGLPRAEATENQYDELIRFCNIHVLTLNSNMTMWINNLYETGKSDDFSIAVHCSEEKEHGVARNRTVDPLIVTLSGSAIYMDKRAANFSGKGSP